MRVILPLALWMVIAAAPPVRVAEKEVAFSTDDLGKAPKGWTVAKTGTGEGSVWAVAADRSAPSGSGHVLAQTAEGPKGLFNLCVSEGSSMQDGEISVSIKAVAGKTDQGGGVVWRYQDANNYYVCRYNPLEENFRVYHVKDGKRTQLQTKEGLALPMSKWFTLSIKHTGNQIECSFEGTKYLEVIDTTFAKAGRVGVWTKADAQSHFDRFRYVVRK